MRRAEGELPPAEPDPLDPIARTRIGRVIRRNGEQFTPGPYLDLSALPLLD
jgi:hypothetical protein